MTRVAAIDCGTNSIRLLIADVDRRRHRQGRGTAADRRRAGNARGPAGPGRGRHRRTAPRRPWTAPSRPPRTMRTLIRGHGAEKVRFVATSATRDARNRQVFVDGIRGPPRRGARGDHRGRGGRAVLRRCQQRPAHPRQRTQVLVVDLGGGSTEFVLGNADGVIAARSVDIGCVRMTERHLRSDPPTPEQIAAAEADVDAAISRGGTARSAGTHHRRRRGGRLGHHHHGACAAPAGVLAGRDPRHRTVPGRGAGGLHGTAGDDRGRSGPRCRTCTPGRVDVIGAGGLVWRRVLQRLAELTDGRITTAVASEHDILDGIALSIS